MLTSTGVKSLARQEILKDKDQPPTETGFAVYRATVDIEKIKTAPELAWLVGKPSLNIWYVRYHYSHKFGQLTNQCHRIGEDRHVMTYGIAAGKSFNMVLSHVDHSDPATWKQETAIRDMRNYFKDWDPQSVNPVLPLRKVCLIDLDW